MKANSLAVLPTENSRKLREKIQNVLAADKRTSFRVIYDTSCDIKLIKSSYQKLKAVAI